MLEIQDLAVAYGRRRVIDEMSLAGLAAGTITSLLGPNGSGKSTLLKALAGLARVVSGSIRLDGTDLTHTGFAARAQKVAYLPQSLPADVHLRAFESVLVAANASSTGHGPVDVGEVQALLERLAIGHLAMHCIDQLSGGQKQLVGLAQALIRRPRLLLLDEPLSALDLHHQFQVMELLAQETRSHGLVTVIVLHDLNIALRHTDHALLIRDGLLHAQGRPQAVINSTTLAEVYGVRGRVEPCSQGYLQVVLDGLATGPSHPAPADFSP